MPIKMTQKGGDDPARGRIEEALRSIREVDRAVESFVGERRHLPGHEPGTHVAKTSPPHGREKEP